MSAAIPGNTSTTATQEIGKTVSGSLDFLGDTDWYRVSLSTGFGYQTWVEGASTQHGTLVDPYLGIYNSGGTFLAGADDISASNKNAYYYFVPTATSTYYFSAGEFGDNATGTYKTTTWLDQLASTSSAATIAVNSMITDRLGWQGDTSDWYRVNLTAGTSYQFDLIAAQVSGGNRSLSDPLLRLRDINGNLIGSNDDDGVGLNARHFFTPSTTGTYFIEATVAEVSDYGHYSLIVNQSPVSGTLNVGNSIQGNTDFNGDTDLYAIQLVAGKTYAFSADGVTLIDPYIEILDRSGLVISSLLIDYVDNDSGPGLNSLEIFTPSSTDTYYLNVHAAGYAGIGTYAARAWELPSLSIADANAQEGGLLDFRIALSHASPVDIHLTAGTRAISASTAANDYQGAWATDLTIAAGQTTATFSVNVTDDHLFEPTEWMKVVLSDADYALLADAEAYGSIIDGDAPYALPSDPLARQQWHLYPNIGVNVLGVWPEYTGRGVRVAVFDQGIDASNPDLAANTLVSLGRNASDLSTGGQPLTASDNHGTAVAGLIAAARNELLGIGIAYNSQLVSIYSPLALFPISSFANQIINSFSYAKTFDIINNSWGTGNLLFGSTQWAFLDDFGNSTWQQAGISLQRLAAEGRSGLGTVVVQSAGNTFSVGDDTNLHNFQNSRYVITVGATDYFGNTSEFSTPGASILVSAPGGSGGSFDANLDVNTTDRLGALGYSTGNNVNLAGTSFSSPIVAGIVALMLEANPNLGYRDVQEILAYSAISTGQTENQWAYNGATNWNGGGLHYDELEHDLGFGLADARAAVRLSESWDQPPRTSSNVLERTYSQNPARAIPDNGLDRGLGGAMDSIQVFQDMLVERVEVALKVTHTFIGDLYVLLTSPSSTTSFLVSRPATGALSAYGSSQDDINFTLNTVLSWGERAVGTWTLGVFDEDSGSVGTLDSWTLRLIGSEIDNDDQYVYTDEFAEAVADQVSRATLNDTGGIDTLNAAAVTTAMTIDLRPDSQSWIDGRTLTITSATTIENAVGGDGEDILRGQDANNHLRGMRGDDTIEGGGGDDYLLGGSGNDTFDWDRSSRSGVDTMEGGTGDDIYVIEGDDQIIELPGEGTDAVWTAASYSLESLPNIENLFLFGTLSATATGNDRDNSISGNQSPNLLKGISGSDIIRGSGGNDTIEGGLGNDYLLGDFGNDTFDWNESSRSGVDTMEGGTGDDIYVIEGDDQIIELPGEGTDAIFAAASYSLEKLPNIENLILFGELQATAIGNDGDNLIYGNTSSNLLRGMSGSDIIKGGAGNDTLDGGPGQDTATFSGARKSYSVRWDATASKLFVTSAAEGADELLNVEELTFSDVSYAASVFQAPSAPTLSSIATLTGAVEDTAYAITWAQLAAAADESDAQGDAIGFQVESVTSGTLTKGGVAVTSGTTVLREGESLVWTGSANAAGTLDAFTIKAVDDALASTTALKVRVEVANVNDAPTGSVTISGTPTQGQTLTAANTLADLDGIPTSGTGAIAYQWRADGALISGATGSTFTLTQAQIGKAISVTASYTDGGGTAESVTSAATAAVAYVNRTPTGSVSITGTPTQGQTLTAANSLADADGLGAITYTWKAGGEVVGGGRSYTLTQTEVGKTITVTASYTDGGNAAESVTSTATTAVLNVNDPPMTNVNDAPNGSVKISGTTTQGYTLDILNRIFDLDGISMSEGTLDLGADYLEGASGIARLLPFRNAISLAYQSSSTFTSSELDGWFKVDILHKTYGWIPFGASPTDNTSYGPRIATELGKIYESDIFKYQWQRNGSPIDGANKPRLKLTQEDVGKIISINITYTDDFGTHESITTSATTPIENINDSPLGVVTIYGAAIQGQTLSASNNLTDADGLGAITYTWKAGATALGTGSTFTLTQAQIGKAISVVASYTDLFGTAESVTSAATVAVGNVDDPATGLVQITGTPVLGALLSSSLSSLLDADGPITSTTWQWQRSISIGQGQFAWSDIASATTSSLTIPPGPDYLGSTLRLAATTVDALGGSTTLFSSPTAAIAGVPTQVSTRFWADAKPIANALVQAGTAAAQATGADGSVALSGIAGPSMTLSAQKPVTSAEAPSHAQAVTLQDAVAILKMISGQAGTAASPTAARAQSLAADFDGSGAASLADAIGVLRHAVGLQAPAPSWVFIEEGDDTSPSPLNPGIPGPVTVEVAPPGPIEINLIGVLRGDVDGSYGVYPV